MNNNITLEQVEKLRAHASVSYEDARAALEAAGGDMLEAIIRLEKEGKTRGQAAGYSTQNPAPVQEGQGGTDWQYGPGRQGPSEFNRQMKRLWKGFCRLVTKGNQNNFEVWREGRCAINFPVTLLAIFLIFFFWMTLPLMFVGLFFGCTYRFSGPDLEETSINKVMNSAAETAEDIKKSINEDRSNNA